MKASSAFALALCAAAMTGCSGEKGGDPMTSFLKNIGANDPAAHLVSSPGLAASQGPAAPEVVPEPEPTAPTCPTLWRGVWTMCDGSTREL